MAENTQHTEYSICVGIDLSMLSTGLVIAVYDKNSNERIEFDAFDAAEHPKRRKKFKYEMRRTVEEAYYILVANEPKSDKKYSTSVKVVSYGRKYDDEGEYALTDLVKVYSAMKLAAKIRTIVKSYMNKYNIKTVDVKMEGSIMSSTFKRKASRLNDLTCFNSIVKSMLIGSPEVENICILTPSALKKYGTGDGSAKKEKMIAQFLHIKDNNFHNKGKIDDVVDAWFLATCEPTASEWVVKSALLDD